MGRWARLLARSPAERTLLLEAAAWLALFRLVILLLPFRWIAPRLGRHMEESGEADDDDAAHRELVPRVGWAVAAAARHVPWQAVCLPQAMAAKAMLRRRGVDSTLYLGVVRDREMMAHAWLRVGGRIVTGGPGVDRYTVVSTFG